MATTLLVSRSYSDLMDTQADFVCIHQLALKPRSKPACIMWWQLMAFQLNIIDLAIDLLVKRLVSIDGYTY